MYRVNNRTTKIQLNIKFKHPNIYSHKITQEILKLEFSMFRRVKRNQRLQQVGDKVADKILKISFKKSANLHQNKKQQFLNPERNWKDGKFYKPVT